MIVACGTSYHAGLVGRYAIEQWARIPVEMDIASEYRYRDPVVGPDDLVIGITQSGETADTLAAMRLARERGATVLGAHQRHGQPGDPRRRRGALHPRRASRSASRRPRPSPAQVAAMYLLGLWLAQARGDLAPERIAELIAELKHDPLEDRGDARERRRARAGDRPQPRRRSASSSTSGATSACRSASRAR